MMKVVVTGGAGFIGSIITKKLVKEYKFQVTVLDDFFTGSKDNLKEVIDDIEIVEGSVVDEKLVKEIIRGKELVFHLAARNIIVSMSNPREDMEVNIKGSFNVFEAAKENPDIKKVVYTSTSSIYGNPRYLPINEEDLPNFLNFYSVSKYAAENYANVFYEAYDLPITIVRYSNVYGYNQTPQNPYCGVIGKFIENALYNKPLLIHGDGEQTRDFTFVEDAAEATILAALSPKSIGRVYNIGTGIETSINKLAKLIIEKTGSNSEIRYIDRRDIDNIRRRCMNIEKMRHDLKFSPKITLEKGIELTVKWFKEKYNIK